MPLAARRIPRSASALLTWIALALTACSEEAVETTCDAGAPPPLVDAPPDDQRNALSLPAEAGFVDVPANDGCLTFPARMFYSFRPADEAPATKPLMVLFNGGPGFPTTLGLLPWGTGPKTLEIPEGGTPQDAEWKDNPYSFTRFTNLLYIDESQTGFSYGRGAPPASPCPEGGEAFRWADAETFVRVVLRFLEDHPAIDSTPVVLLGKSYGSYRALHMLDLLLHHEELRDAHPELSEEVARHFRRVAPEHSGPFAARDVARQFGNLASIQGAFYPTSFACTKAAPEGRDTYDMDKPAGWEDAMSLRAATLWVEQADSDSMVGSPLADVEGLTPPERGDAFRLPTREGGEAGQTIISEGLADKLGALPEGDAYFGAMTADVDGALSNVAEREPLLTVLPYVRLFATNALRDRVVCTSDFLELVGATLDESPRDGQERPGRVELETNDGCGYTMRVPTYAKSGHNVPASQPRELAEDLEAWMRGD